MNSIIGFVLFALVSSAFVAAEDDFEQLHSKLFSKDAEVLEKEQVIELLKKIQPLVKSSSNDRNEITKEDIDALLRASVLSESRCLSYDEFLGAYRTLSLRNLFKKNNQILSGPRLESWNENIKNYINACEREQFEVCLREFREDMSKVSVEDTVMVDGISKKLDMNIFFQHELADAILEVVEPKLQQKSSHKLSVKNIGLKSKVEVQFEEIFNNLIDSCKRIDEASDDHSGVIVNVLLRSENNLTVDEESRVWAKRIHVCEKIIEFTFPELAAAGNRLRPLSGPLYPDLLKKVLKKY